MAYGKHPVGGEVHRLPVTHVHKQRLLTWLCTPKKEREPPKLEDLAEELGVTRRTLTNWKVDPEFLEAWNTMYLRTIGSPEVKSEIMHTLKRTATDPDDPKHVQAAKTYFEIEGSLKPQTQQIEVKRSATDLTDDELDAILAHKIGEQKAS